MKQLLTYLEEVNGYVRGIAKLTETCDNHIRVREIEINGSQKKEITSYHKNIDESIKGMLVDTRA